MQKKKKTYIRQRTKDAVVCMIDHRVATWCCTEKKQQVLGGRPPDDRVNAGASLYTCVMCLLTDLAWLGV